MSNTQQTKTFTFNKGHLSELKVEVCLHASKKNVVASKKNVVAPKNNGVAPKNNGVAPKKKSVAPKNNSEQTYSSAVGGFTKVKPSPEPVTKAAWRMHVKPMADPIHTTPMQELILDSDQPTRSMSEFLKDPTKAYGINGGYKLEENEKREKFTVPGERLMSCSYLQAMTNCSSFKNMNPSVYWKMVGCVIGKDGKHFKEITAKLPGIDMIVFNKESNTIVIIYDSCDGLYGVMMAVREVAQQFYTVCKKMRSEFGPLTPQQFPIYDQIPMYVVAHQILGIPVLETEQQQIPQSSMMMMMPMFQPYQPFK
jgi:hypothetical protein